MQEDTSNSAVFDMDEFKKNASQNSGPVPKPTPKVIQKEKEPDKQSLTEKLLAAEKESVVAKELFDGKKEEEKVELRKGESLALDVVVLLVIIIGAILLVSAFFLFFGGG